jgi:hypothetical protein
MRIRKNGKNVGEGCPFDIPPHLRKFGGLSNSANIATATYPMPLLEK